MEQAMPRIKAYKGNGSIIPVEEAKISTAFRCPWTGKLYGQKRPYVNHLKSLREERMHKRARQVRKNKIRAEFNNCATFDEVINWIETHPEFFWDTRSMLGFPTGYSAEILATLRETFMIRITKLNLRWSREVSNTHSCPYNGVTNWGGRKPDAPRSYPGWHGHIEFTVSAYNPKTGKTQSPLYGSSVYNNVGINIGTGGARGGMGEQRYNYGVELFDADWPEIAKRHDKLVMLAALGDDNSFNKHFFNYSIDKEKSCQQNMYTL
jgi:hypothetical protein